jgi:bleomycin hydrolase
MQISTLKIKIRRFKKVYVYLLTFLFSFTCSLAQNLEGFRIIKKVPVTKIKDQGYSGTCWSFATVSFLESEALRLGKGTFDLSEMFIVRHIYPEKAKNYFRTQGYSFFTAGSQCHDVLYVMKNVGLVPENAYPQKNDFLYSYNTAELDTATLYFVKNLRKNEEDSLPKNWQTKFEKILNKHLGIPPSSFLVDNKSYSPKTFCSDVLGLKADNYIQITSYNHHPFREYFCLESRFNWAFGLYYNLPLDEFINLIDKSINNGYSVAFNGDISENSFNFSTGIASIDETNISQDRRQYAFENSTTTVDHVMHIVGIAEDEKGKKYYLTKNSWGKENICGGYMYLSEDYLRLKAVSLLVHKDML